MISIQCYPALFGVLPRCFFLTVRALHALLGLAGFAFELAATEKPPALPVHPTRIYNLTEIIYV